MKDRTLAGVALPGLLIALAALRTNYAPGAGATQQSPAPGVPAIPPSGDKAVTRTDAV